MAKKKAIKKVLSCFFVFVILVSLIPVSVSASDGSSDGMRDVLDSFGNDNTHEGAATCDLVGVLNAATYDLSDCIFGGIAGGAKEALVGENTELNFVVALTEEPCGSRVHFGDPIQWFVYKPDGTKIEGEKVALTSSCAGGPCDNTYYDFPDVGVYTIKIKFLDTGDWASWTVSATNPLCSISNLAHYPYSPKDVDLVNLYADVTSVSPITSVKAYWSIDKVNWNIITMVVYSVNTYITKIRVPAQPAGTTVYYKIHATNSGGTAVSSTSSYTVQATTTGSLTGRVTDSSGKGINGATVTLGSWTTKTDLTAHYRFIDKTKGEYDFKVEKTGYNAYTGTATVGTGTSTKDVQLTIEQSPEIELTPSTHDFGEVRTDVCTVSFSFILKNVGGGTATGEVYLTGGDKDLFIITNGKGSFTLDADQTKTIGVAFSPTSAGSKSATLYAKGSNCNNAQSSLSGTGEEMPQVQIEPITIVNNFNGRTPQYLHDALISGGQISWEAIFENAIPWVNNLDPEGVYIDNTVNLQFNNYQDICKVTGRLKPILTGLNVEVDPDSYELFTDSIIFVDTGDGSYSRRIQIGVPTPKYTGIVDLYNRVIILVPFGFKGVNLPPIPSPDYYDKYFCPVNLQSITVELCDGSTKIFEVNEPLEAFWESPTFPVSDYFDPLYPREIMYATSLCPVNMLVVDENGRKLGTMICDGSPLEFHEIPNAIYSGDTEPEYVIFVTEQNYSLTIQAVDAGQFNLTLLRGTISGTTNITYSDVQITETTIATVNVSLENPNYIMKIDYNSDGTTDKTKEPDTIETIRTDNPILCTSPDPPDHDFGIVPKGQTRSWSFDITNCGSDTLTWTVSCDQPWIKVNPSSGSTTTKADRVTITIDASGFAAGTHMGHINVTTNDGNKTGMLKVNIPGPVKNLNTCKSFSTIQASIEDNDTLDGHLITVAPGTYIENIEVTKSLMIRSTSENPQDTIIQAKESGSVIHVYADSVEIRGFTTKGATYFGIDLSNANFCNITNNDAHSNTHLGISLSSSSNNIIRGNSVSNNGGGISIQSNSNNNIIDNNIANSNGCHGIDLKFSSNGNTITGNTARLNYHSGIQLSSSSSNTIIGNTVSNNDFGIRITDSSLNNKVFLNNLIEDHGTNGDPSNIWNSIEEMTYTYEGNTYKCYLGNYWGDYEKNYPSAKEIDHTGIWNTPYEIPWKGYSKDNYPLKEPSENYLVKW